MGNTVSLRSDAAATIYFVVYLVWLTIQGWRLFEGGVYSRVASIQGWRLFEGGVYFFWIYTSLAKYILQKVGFTKNPVKSKTNEQQQKRLEWA